jgi:hypothetical protein
LVTVTGLTNLRDFSPEILKANQMKYRPSLAFILCLTPLLAAGAAGGWAWNKANSERDYAPAGASFLWVLRYMPYNDDYRPPTLERIMKTREEATKRMDQLVAEFPALRITEHPVPDDQNGFLLFYKLSGVQGVYGTPLTKEFQEFLDQQGTDDKIPWSPEIAKRCLAGNAHVVDQIERIASLKTRSSANMPAGYDGYTGVTVPLHSVYILLLKARLAAEAKDEKETLRLVAAAQNIASHFREIETPTLFCETATVVIDCSIHQETFKHLIPALGRDADLTQWRSVLAPRSYTPADLAKTMRGEWYTMARFSLFPRILDPNNPDVPPDAEALAHAYASSYSMQVTRLNTMSFEEFARQDYEFNSAPFAQLSGKSRQIAKKLFRGINSWVKGYARAASISAQYQAAFDLLILEKSGKKLVPGLAAEITRDPISGSPFLFDPATRVLSPPPAAAKLYMKPLSLPW